MSVIVNASKVKYTELGGLRQYILAKRNKINISNLILTYNNINF